MKDYGDLYEKELLLESEAKQEAEEHLKEALEKAGVQVKCSGTLRTAHSQFIAHSKYVTIDYYSDLKKEVPEVKSRQFVYDPATYMCADTDFTIVTGGDNKF